MKRLAPIVGVAGALALLAGVFWGWVQLAARIGGVLVLVAVLLAVTSGLWVRAFAWVSTAIFLTDARADWRTIGSSVAGVVVMLAVAIAPAWAPDVLIVSGFLLIGASVLLRFRGDRMNLGGLTDFMRPGRHARRVKRGWRTLCRRAGWSKGPEKNPRYPELLGARQESHAVVVRWRPFEANNEGVWGEQVHALRRFLRAPTARWHIDPTDAGVIEAHVGLRPLPKRRELKARPKLASAGPDAAIWIGPRAGGGDAVWRPYECPHMLISGETRGGKGGLLRLILAQTVGAWRVVVINPKRAGEFNWIKRFPGDHVIHNDLDAQVAALQDIERERDRRQVLIEADGLDDWTQLHPRPVPVLVMVDELSELLDGREEPRRKAARLLLGLARLGASAGVFLVVAAQRPDVSGGVLGKGGGAMRDQFAARVAVGSLSPDGLRMVHPGADADVAAGLPGIRGRALVSRLDAESGRDVYGVQIGWLPQNVLVPDGAVSDATATPPPTGEEDAVRTVSDTDRDTAGTAADTTIAPSDTHVAGVVDVPVTEPNQGHGTPPSAGADAPGGRSVMSAVEVAAVLGVDPRTVSRRAADPASGVRRISRGRYVLEAA